MSSPSNITSPRLTPIRSRSRLALGTLACCADSAVWISRLLKSASVTLAKSASHPSPVPLTTLPRKRSVTGSTISSVSDRTWVSVRVSSRSMSCEYPTTSATTTAASLRDDGPTFHLPPGRPRIRPGPAPGRRNAAPSSPHGCGALNGGRRVSTGRHSEV